MSDEKRDDRRRSAPERLDTLLGAVLELPPEERDRWIDESSTGNAALRGQLRDMLRKAEADAAHRSSPAETEYLPSSGVPARRAAELAAAGPPAPTSRPPRPSRSASTSVAMRSSICSASAAWAASIARSTPLWGVKSRSRRLADAFRGDSASLRRFEREARVLATLSHPNIATIYGFERLNGSPYLVLERVEGDTLAQRLARGPLPIDEALAIAVQIIAGLEEAHAKGVIHRDLKPSNVMLTPDGRVKLVDFGLAKTPAPRATATSRQSRSQRSASSLGTARYMSPEQVRGEDVDTRTDVWAFGCVLYEMLTGRPASPGRSVSEVVAAVLRDDPDWRALPPTSPPGIIRLFRRCLRRDPRDRLQHIGDARLELLDGAGRRPQHASWRAPGTRMRRIRWSIVAALMIAGADHACSCVLAAQRDAAPPAAA